MAKKIDKVFRLLQMHERLSKGETIIKDNSIEEYNIPPKSFQRDINSLRLYYTQHGEGELIYDRKLNCYRLAAKQHNLTKEEIFAVCKVLIESRAFNKAEFDEIITKLLCQCEIPESKAVKSVIANEQVNYIPLSHGKPLIEKLWQLAGYEKEQTIIEITYIRPDGTVREHEIKPVGVMFSEFYFYLISYMADDSKPFPTVFRVDRIISLQPTEQKFNVPYTEKFSESEFRKRVQFMYGGDLRTVRFLYKGVVESVLDRLPTARIEKKTKNGVIIKAEAYGSGIDIWLQSQGDKIEIL